jgi:hypothetical protein
LDVMALSVLQRSLLGPGHGRRHRWCRSDF